MRREDSREERRPKRGRELLRSDGDRVMMSVSTIIVFDVSVGLTDGGLVVSLHLVVSVQFGEQCWWALGKGSCVVFY